MCKIIEGVSRASILKSGFQIFIAAHQTTEEELLNLYARWDCCALKGFKISGGENRYEFQVFGKRAPAINSEVML